jgi:hypothetical protein
MGGERRNTMNIDTDNFTKQICSDKKILIKALRDIIAQCPHPKLPYGATVVGIAKGALREVGESTSLDI